jgi:hypothetical protein
MKTRLLISISLAFISWLLMHVYSDFRFTNPHLKDSLVNLSFAIRVVNVLTWIVLVFPFLASVFFFRICANSRIHEIVQDLLFAIAIIWPLVVLTAWQVQGSPFIDLRGIH